MRTDDAWICGRCGKLYGDHVFERNRRRCEDGQAFKAGYWTDEEIAADLMTYMEAE